MIRVDARVVHVDPDPRSTQPEIICPQTGVGGNPDANSAQIIGQLPRPMILDRLHLRDARDRLGIPEDVLPKVMNPFFTTKGQQGTGLGLAICKEIIEAEHLGDFSIANHPEQGVEIVIRLPERRGTK